jgi:hypothetical protein
VSKAKKDILDMIDQKAKRYTELRKKSQNKRTPQQLILNFLDETEKLFGIADNASDWYRMIDQLTKSLDEQMKIIDLGAKMEVMWNQVKDWRELRVTGVKIRWSSWYREKHDLPEEQLIDVTLLLLEDFDE